MSKLFEKPIPSVAVQRSSFGGGWVWGLNEAGSLALISFFQEPASEIPTTSNRPGWIVEPYQASDLSEHLQSCGLTWELQ